MATRTAGTRSGAQMIELSPCSRAQNTVEGWLACSPARLIWMLGLVARAACTAKLINRPTVPSIRRMDLFQISLAQDRTAKNGRHHFGLGHMSTSLSFVISIVSQCSAICPAFRQAAGDSVGFHQFEGPAPDAGTFSYTSIRHYLHLIGTRNKRHEDQVSLLRQIQLPPTVLASEPRITLGKLTPACSPVYRARY